jgi:hypothetical protein
VVGRNGGLAVDLASLAAEACFGPENIAAANNISCIPHNKARAICGSPMVLAFDKNGVARFWIVQVRGREYPPTIVRANRYSSRWPLKSLERGIQVV